MSELLNNIYNYFDEMDFVAQKKVNLYYKVIILIVAVISFGVAYAKQQFSICVYATLGAAAFCALVFGPGWPFWKRNHVAWQKSKTEKAEKAD